MLLPLPRWSFACFGTFTCMCPSPNACESSGAKSVVASEYTHAPLTFAVCLRCGLLPCSIRYNIFNGGCLPLPTFALRGPEMTTQLVACWGHTGKFPFCLWLACSESTFGPLVSHFSDLKESTASPSSNGSSYQKPGVSPTKGRAIDANFVAQQLAQLAC